MPAIALKILTWALTSVALREFALGILAALAARTDNAVDDMFVEAASRALDIRVPDDLRAPTVPPHNAVFLDEAEITEVKQRVPRAPRVDAVEAPPTNSRAFHAGVDIGKTAQPARNRKKLSKRPR